jgi:predicted DNA-binding protein
MEKSITTSVRLPRRLKRRIDQRAIAAGCGRNRVIIEALELYLREDEQAAYASEASRQSKLAAKLDVPDEAWERMVEGDFFRP